MDPSWVAAIASVASAFIVGVAAIAAMLQIRHIRNANEITIYLHLVDRLESANAAEAFRSFEDFVRQLQTDRSLRYRLAQPRFVPEFQEIETLLRFLDNLTMLIFTGSVTERLILTKYADDIVRLWDSLAEAVYLRRYGVPHFASTYEHLAMRAKAYLAGGIVDRFYGQLLQDPRMTGITAPEPPDSAS
ncbi:MAG: hypothetical protein WAK84_10520 [Candidatus Cybelea sp.]